MVRPFLRYPVNHHLAQILERAVAIAAVRAGPRHRSRPASSTATSPSGPGQWPRIGGRFGDSWSARLTGDPVSGLTLQGSYAHVHSPEHRPGRRHRPGEVEPVARGGSGRSAGIRSTACSSGRAPRRPAGSSCSTACWPKVHGPPGPIVSSTGSSGPSGPRRSGSRGFRSLRPHLENSILGTTRWTTHTVGLRGSAPLGARPARGPAARRGRVCEHRQGGRRAVRRRGAVRRRHIWSLTVGVRLAGGMPMHRMGRYGAAEDRGR